ncbi:MAG: helix-turn-helix domain-containing protein [Actinomycetota bacterium]
MLTVPEAARRVGRDPETVRRWIRSGKLRSRKVGTQHLVDEGDLEEFMDDGDMLPLPDEWKVMSDGRRQINWVRIIRRQREGH